MTHGTSWQDNLLTFKQLKMEPRGVEPLTSILFNLFYHSELQCIALIHNRLYLLFELPEIEWYCAKFKNDDTNMAQKRPRFPGGAGAGAMQQ
jgi:hypothetical protein